VRYDLGPADRHACLCLSRLRFLPALLKERLRAEGIFDDLIQAIYTAALEAWEQGMDQRQTYRHAARRIYAFLTAYGYRHYPIGYVRREVPFSQAFGDKNIWDSGLTAGPPASPFIRRRLDDHLDEAILALLRRNPQGMSKRDLYTRLKLPARLFDHICAPLIEQGLVREVKRPIRGGRPPTPLLIAESAPAAAQRG